MKIKDLIKELQKFDENQELVLIAHVENKWGSFSTCFDGILFLSQTETNVQLIVEGNESED
jgi:ACT domain-containing protein